MSFRRWRPGMDKNRDASSLDQTLLVNQPDVEGIGDAAMGGIRADHLLHGLMPTRVKWLAVVGMNQFNVVVFQEIPDAVEDLLNVVVADTRATSERIDRFVQSGARNKERIHDLPLNCLLRELLEIPG